MIKNKSGVWGELYTARYLRDNKYDIISSDYACRAGEIDIVAMKNNTLCFVEVKARSENALLRPADAVDKEKRKRIILAARNFLSFSKLDCKTRFDVCEIILSDDFEVKSLNYIENAFQADRL